MRYRGCTLTPTGRIVSVKPLCMPYRSRPSRAVEVEVSGRYTFTIAGVKAAKNRIAYLDSIGKDSEK